MVVADNMPATTIQISRLLGGRNHHGRLTSRPAAEARRNGLLLLDHVSQRVEAVRHEHVGVLRDGPCELAVRLGRSLSGSLLLLGDPGIRNLGLEGIDAVLGLGIEAHHRNGDVLDLDVGADLLTQVALDLGRQVAVARRCGVALVVGGQRVDVLEHLVDRRVQASGHEAVADPVEVPVVLEETVGRVRLDLPPDRDVDTRERLVRDARRDAGRVVLGVATLERVGLDRRVERIHLLPRGDPVQATADRFLGFAERGRDADLLGLDAIVRRRQQKTDDQRRTGDETDLVPAEGTIGHRPAQREENAKRNDDDDGYANRPLE